MRQTKHRWTSMTGQNSGRMRFKLTLMSWRYGARRQIHLQNLPFQNCDASDKKEDEVMACTLTADEAFSKLIEVSLASTQECTWGCGRMVTVKGLLLVPCSISQCEMFASIPALLSPPALSFVRIPPALHQGIQTSRLRLFSHEAWTRFFWLGSYSSKCIDFDPGRVPPQTLLLLSNAGGSSCPSSFILRGAARLSRHHG